jgi:multicomponent Na+:H+ antiporter subunit G
MNRVHAGGVGDTLGLFLVALSILLGDGFHMGELKLGFIIIFMWFTSPVSSHVLIQVEYFTNPHLYDHVKREIPEMETEEEK